ncbi:uncharacterized protein L203_103685 [Cryptococcus depauperatus CBS 7841]|uniref:Uncharacterized protein n=1 Tax=Cryptococcus depauperatus CBS 7841 TaxID=1295531 RepID=A0A1E3IH26_9TREE|nr:hypothetical protein L203_03815 [Cryptococcus depauperatus CBS 7841]
MDDLLELNWAEGSKSKTVNPKQPAAFDFLAKPAPSNAPNYHSSTLLRPTTPLSAPLAPNSSRATPSRSGASTPSILPSTQTTAAPEIDAFSSLLSVSGPGPRKSLTMAEKQAAIAEEKRKQETAKCINFEANNDFWENLGRSNKPAINNETSKISVKQDSQALLQPTSAVASSLGSQISRSLSTDSSLTPSPAPSKSSPAHGSFWDSLQDNGSPAEEKKKLTGEARSQIPSPAPQSRPQLVSPADSFDFDAFEFSQPQSTNGSICNVNGGDGTGRLPTIGASDPFFDKDYDDIFDHLSKANSPEPHNATHRSIISSKTKPDSMSPPPHIVGQIVEMGFGPTQAREALAQTSDGLDVQAAINILLGPQNDQAAEFGREQVEISDLIDTDHNILESERQKHEEAERERRRKRRAGPSRESVKARTVEERERDALNAQDQAERILAQASEIGQNMFQKATLFWNQGKEKAFKAYEEQKKAFEDNTTRQNGQEKKKIGRPKWMEESQDWKNIKPHKVEGGFRDSDDEEQDNMGPMAGSSSTEPADTTKPRTQKGSTHINHKRTKSPSADLLFNGHEPTLNKTSALSSPQTFVSLKTTSKPTTPVTSRKLISATPSQLQACATHKTKGNEHFKLGRFTEAESSYSLAISSLPNGHLFLIPLLNNRATTRLKLGDSSNAVSDCTTVIAIIGLDYHPSKEAPLPSEYAEIKLGESITKALVKRAQACEMGEKWQAASEDWERVMGLDHALLGAAAGNTRNMAIEGARRARKMIEGDQRAKSSTAITNVRNRPTKLAVKPKPNPDLSRPTDVSRSAAVADLRKATKAIEAEEEARLKYKDAVDAKIAGWKAGKEENLRALIASLDTVLWDNIMKGGMKVGMHELVTDKQVKVKYMKVIARLHPDKLDTKGTTVEQRMLANAAFGTLNEAWQSFNT